MLGVIFVYLYVNVNAGKGPLLSKRYPVESIIRPRGEFGLTPGKLLTLNKPNPYPKSVRNPAQKLRKHPNVGNPLGNA